MNLRTVRKKIKSVKNVRKITKAMQMVSAVKMRKAQQAESESRPYREGLKAIIQRLAPNIDPSYSALLQDKHIKSDRNLIVLVSSNKGLAGAFNVNLIRHLLRKNLNFDHTDFVTIGNKGAQFVSRMGSKVLADFSQGTPTNEVSAVFSFALEKFLAGEYKTISLVYNKFISTLKSEIADEVLLPVQALDLVHNESEKIQGEYVIEPSPQEIIDYVIKSYVEDKIRGAIISSEAVEHSSRMLAMKNATDNAGDLIYNLTSLGNKLRQEKITSELLDMVTAKESVEGA